MLNVRLLPMMLLVVLELLQNAAASAPGDCSVEDDMFSQYMDHLGSQPLLICVNIELPSYKTPK